MSTRAIRGAMLAIVLSLAPTVGAVESWSSAGGEQVVLVEDRRAPVVTVRLQWPLGKWSVWSRSVPLEAAVESMRFDRERQVREELDRLGATLQLHVGRRSSTLILTVLREELDPALALLQRILTAERLDRAELRRRRRESNLAFKFRLTDPMFLAERSHAAALFPREDPRYRAYFDRPPAESPARLLATREALIAHPRRKIGFAGAITRNEAEAAVANLLPPKQEMPAAFERTAVGPVNSAREDAGVELKKLTQVYFSYTRPSLPLDDPDYPAFLIVDYVLGGNFYSRLASSLRHDGGESYGAWSRSYGDVDAHLYSLITFTRVDNAAATEKKLRDVVAVLHAAGIGEDERVEALAYLAGRRAFGRQAPRQILGRWFYEDSLGLSAGYLDKLVERAARLTPQQIEAFVQRFYDPRHFSMVRVGPPAPRGG